MVRCRAGASLRPAVNRGRRGATRSLELARFYEQQADRAQRQLLASVESLARVRKLNTPIQINIAEQQVNVAGTVRHRSK
jgi:hypothetical protein